MGCGVLFWAGFSSAEWFGTEFRQFASIFVPRNGIPSCFIFRWRVWKGIPRVCFYFCSTEQNSEFFSLPRKGLERNSGFFLFRGTAGIPSEITVCSVYSVSRGIIFLSEIPNPSYGWVLAGDCGDLWQLAIGICSFCLNTYFRFHLLQPN